MDTTTQFQHKNQKSSGLFSSFTVLTGTQWVYGCFQAGVSEQSLNDTDVVACLKQMCGKGMAEGHSR